MATNTQQRVTYSRDASAASDEPSSLRRTPPREGSWTTRVLVGAVVLLIVGGAAWGAVHLMSNRTESVARQRADHEGSAR